MATNANQPKTRKYGILWCGQLAGWPEPLVFDTAREARQRAQKIAHQGGGLTEVVFYYPETGRTEPLP